MNIAEYLTHHDIPVSLFAKEVQIHRTSMYRYMKGLAFPRLTIMKRIIKATDGWVTATDLTDHYNEVQDAKKTEGNLNMSNSDILTDEEILAHALRAFGDDWDSGKGTEYIPIYCDDVLGTADPAKYDASSGVLKK